MDMRTWRNPYLPIHKRKERNTSSSAQPVAAGSLAVTPRKLAIPMDLRTSVTRMRTNIKGISHTIRQVEETMDTIYGAMEMLESLGKSGARPPAPSQATSSRPVKPAEDHHTSSEPAPESASPLGGALGSLDVNQLLSILQSPLVQSLLNQQTNSGTTKRKKEG
ncbi:MAG: hypothetical protein H0Z34_04770 [Brevibacillus sp.]|nr:hypothetical protein [Brevibacillus sp.]